MSEEKESIGQDVLSSGYSTSTMSPKKRRELEKKLKEQLEAKRKAEEEAKRKEELEKLPKESIPGEKPGEMSPEKRAELIARASLTGEMLEAEEKTVDVKKHKRRPPKKKEKFEEIF